MSDTVIAHSDRPLKMKLKPELQSIANAMGLNPDLTVPFLIKSIEQFIKSYPEIADNPKFLPFFVHRTTKAGSKNSADKETEEAGNRTLLEHNVKTDPPAQFARLSLGSRNHSTGAGSGNKSDDDGDESSDPGIADMGSRKGSPTPEPDDKPKKNQIKQQVPGLVQVNFYDENDHSAAHRQVCVLSKEVPITVVAAEDGSTATPLRFRNFFPLPSRMILQSKLGKIDAIFLGEFRALNIGEVDQYTLRTSAGGSLFCDVFWDQSAQAVGGANASISAPVAADTAAATHQASVGCIFGVLTLTFIEMRLQFMGSGSDVPLAIATDRAMHIPTGRIAAPGVRDACILFLHGVIKATIVDIPPFGQNWPRANYAGMMLDRLFMQEKVFELFTAWNRPTGGYTVHAGYDDYSGVTFTNDEILDAIGIKSSSSSSVAVLFSPQTLIKAPKAKAWYESGGRTHDDFFRKMTSAAFKKYVAEDHRRRGTTKIPASVSGATARRNLPHKKAAAVDSSDDSEDERRYAKRSSNHTGAGKSIDSDTLDSPRRVDSY
ncbi:hypothetical protein B0H10DRAFT_2325590 [Mycena sp. CBHHK59/15]|nr:hypothetical protein B0H10DRAFT_2325590 [Mycena sp. CBHHK59/15]